ncbi:MAG: 6-bladed beta-propeller [Saprospiraceae bacterium]|nr:6-bladed beta-propeller [Saprospiraceae bacterium]
MIRRSFIKHMTTYSIGGLAYGKVAINQSSIVGNLVVGHNSHRYKIDLNWGALNSNIYPVNDCHEMVQDSKGRIVLLTNHVKNNVIIYNRQGDLEEVWGTSFPGAHGLTLNIEEGQDYLYIADNNRHEVIKTTIDGKVVNIFPCPLESGKYDKKNQYVPTETAIASNGDIYVADGYGLQYIMHYNASGELKNIFGGRGSEEKHFDNAHGICIDTRNDKETLLITDRMNNKLKRFTMEGQLISVTHLPGAFICRPVIHGDNVYLATIWSGDGNANTGFISILDKDNKLISAPCGSKPVYKNGKLKKMYQTLKVFQHPHDVCVDDDENLYVAQWNSGQSYPIKLVRI